MDRKERLKQVLSENGYSVTSQRLRVFNELQKADEPMTVVDLAGRLTNVDRVSSYRTIELFEKIGIIHRVWTGFKNKVELSEAFSSHHHHFTCIKCGKSTGLKSELLERELKNFETEHGFKLVQHSVELNGYCANCKTSSLSTTESVGGTQKQKTQKA